MIQQYVPGKAERNRNRRSPCILEVDKSSKEYRKNWARLIQKIYEVDPLACPKCRGIMYIISFIEDREVIKAIPRHLGLWLVRLKLTPKAHAPPCPEPEQIRAGRIRRLRRKIGALQRTPYRDKEV